MIDFEELNKQTQKFQKHPIEERFLYKYANIFEVDYGLLKKDLKEIYPSIYVLEEYFEKFPFLFSFKESNRFNLRILFNNPDDNVILQWWVEKALKIKEEVDRINFLLIFKKNYYPYFFITTKTAIKEALSMRTISYLKALLSITSDKLLDTFIVGKVEDLLKEINL